MTDEFLTCDKCGQKKAWKIGGSKTSYDTHCWNCDHVEHVEVVDF